MLLASRIARPTRPEDRPQGACRAGVRTGLRTLAALLAVLFCLAAATLSRADDPYRATTSRQAREDALRSIPFDELNEDGRAKVSAVLGNLSVYRRLPTQVIRCDPDLYLFMVNHPDVTVNLWQVLGVTQISLERTGTDTFAADDKAGTKGDVQFLYRGADVHLIYAVGTHEGALFQKPVRGGCLLLLKTGYIREPDGHYYITSQLDTFFNVEHLGLDVLARTFQPLVGKAADYNFAESASFLSSLSRSGETRPAAMQHLAARLNNIQPKDRDRFALVMATLSQKAAERTAASGQPRPLSQAPAPPQPNLRR